MRKFLSQVCLPGQLWRVSQANSFVPSLVFLFSACTGGDVRYRSSKWLRRGKLSGSHKLKRVMGEFMGSSTLNAPCSFSIALELTVRQQLTGLYFILRSLYFKKPICCFLPLPLQFLSWKQMIMGLGLPCHCLKCPLRSLFCFCLPSFLALLGAPDPEDEVWGFGGAVWDVGAGLALSHVPAGSG